MSHRSVAEPPGRRPHREGGGKPPHDPPPGSPWDDELGVAPLAFVDLEMTGLRPTIDRVIEICVERVRGGRVEARLETLVRPDSGVFGNTHVHGIAPGDVTNAPTFAELAPAVVDLLHGAVPIAHGAAWDVAFLEAELSRVRRAAPVAHYLDTLTLSRRALALPSHSLAALCTSLGLDRGRGHRAGDDVRALRQLWDRLVEVLGPRSPRDLWHVRVGQRHARPEIVAAALEASAGGDVVLIRYRPARKGLEELRFVVTAVRTDLDPPRVLGYLDASRGRRELRADRILAIESA